MSTTEEVYKIQLQAEGDAVIKRAAAEVARMENLVERLIQKYKSGVLDQRKFAAGAEVLGSKLAAARSSLDAYERAAAGAGGKGGRNLGMAALEAGRALEDLNFGIIGVINNIPQLAMALGASAGVTGIIAAAGAAVLLLSRNWETLSEALGGDATRTAAEDMERLEKATSRTADEEERLQRLKRQQSGSDAQASALTESQQAQQGAVRRSVVEGNRRAIVEGIRLSAPGALADDPEVQRTRAMEQARQVAQLRAQGDFEAAEQIERTGGYGDTGAGVAERAKIAHELRQAQDAAAGRLLGAAETDPRALQRLIGLVRANPGAFPEGLAEQLAGSTPEAQRQGSYEKQVRAGAAQNEVENRANADRYFAEQSSARSKRARDDAAYRAENDRNFADHQAEQAKGRREAESVEKENQANADRYFAAQQKRAEELAGPLRDRFDLTTISGAALGEGDVRAELLRSGIAAGEAGALAGPVLRSLQSGFGERIREEAAKAGISPEEAEQRLGRLHQAGRHGQALARAREQMADRMEAMKTNRPSQVMDAQGYLNAIQSAVGGINYQQQMLDSLRKQETQNDRLIREIRDINRF